MPSGEDLALEPVDVRAGGWCDEHALPHVISCEVVTLSAVGVGVVGTLEVCDE